MDGWRAFIYFDETPEVATPTKLARDIAESLKDEPGLPR
jgi:hypothetical protein